MDKTQITQRHYDIVIKQGFDNLPYEAGGFMGGKNDLVQALLPIYNKHDDNRRDNFVFYSNDLERAHSFFQSHKQIQVQ